MSNRKLNKLKTILKKLDSAVIAYSGGVDSVFLLKTAIDTLGGDRVLAVTAKSELFPDSELKEAEILAKRLGARHIIIKTNELKNNKFVKNPPNRCYYCKKELFSKLKDLARTEGFRHVTDGTNADDLKDIRYGRKAAEELGIKSPLLDAGLTKQNIRDISKSLKLPTWQKGTFACLASRFLNGHKIDKSKLSKIERLEDYLKYLRFNQVRVRLHGDMVRIEVGKGELGRLTAKGLRDKVLKKCKELGFRYITLDLAGYRTGSMNPAPTRKHLSLR